MKQQILFAKLLYIKYLNSHFPKSSAHLFAGLWFQVIKSKENPKRSHWLSQSKSYLIPHRGHDLPIYIHHQPNPKGQVILVHGWSGRWDQMMTIGENLRTKGLEIVFFDLPAHGENPGSESDVSELAEFLGSIAKKLNLNSPMVVCHSAGFLALSRAKVAGTLVPSKIVAIGSPARFDYLIEVFSKKLNFSSKMISELWKIVEKRIHLADPKTQLDTSHMGSIASKDVFIIHDLNDKEVTFSQSDEMKKIWPDARFLQTKKLGHNRILSDPQVINEISEFLLDETKT